MNTARDKKLPLSRLDLSSIPEWPEGLISEAFIRIRDERFLFNDGMSDFPRRIPWLYVKNGCFLKAALVRRFFAKHGYPQIRKLFVFGEMEFRTSFSPDGKMSFKDHVAAAARNKGKVFLFDPSVSPDAPIELLEWARILDKNSDPDNLEYSLCSPFTFSHNSPADAPSEEHEAGPRDGMVRDVDFFTQDFLKKEWSWVKEFNMRPEEILFNASLVCPGRVT